MEDILFLVGKENIKQKISITSIMMWLLVIFVIFVSLYVYIFQKKNYIYFQKIADNFKNISFILPAKRGNILDANNKYLVKSIESWNLYINLDKATDEEKEIFLNLAKAKKIFYRGNYAFISNLSLDEISSVMIKITNEKNKYKYLELIPSFSRENYLGEAAGSMIGYLGFDENAEDDIFVGKAGLELTYDNYLKGKEGKIVYQHLPNGDKGDKIEEIEPVDGYDIKTTIISDFQKKAYELMKNYFEENNYKRGALIALNPKTGAVYALISYPSYNPDWFLNNIQQATKILSDPNHPLFNRAIAGLYSPGSTIKPIVAIGALSENVITPEKKIYAGGELKIPNPYIPGTYSIFRDNKVHGWTDMKKAIAESVNIYFYILGGGFGDQPGLGIEKLIKWWKIFQLDQLSGIDILGEKPGFLPTPENKKELHPIDPIWRLGDTYNVSIGQGDLLVTPLRITLWTSALATNKLVKPFLVQEIKDKHNNIIFQRKTEYIWENLLNDKYLKIVQEGMRQTVTNGTAKYLNDLPFPVAGKSGTPEILGKKKLNAIFTGYAPYPDPEIVMTLLIEDVPLGSVATLPLYKQIITEYFKITHPEFFKM